MRTYPIMLNLTGRLAVVVGAGPVGLRKARTLLEAGAKVRLIAPRIDRKKLPAGLEVVRKTYRPELVAGAFLVVACTDDRGVNSRIATDARAAGALVNAADQPEDCDFFLPALLRRGEVVVAIGTGGAVPALAAALKAKVAAVLPERVSEFAATLSGLRDELKGLIGEPSRRMEIMKALSGEKSFRRFLSGRGMSLRDTMAAMARKTGRLRAKP
jgi:siroheme synthase-like protein